MESEVVVRERSGLYGAVDWRGQKVWRMDRAAEVCGVGGGNNVRTMITGRWKSKFKQGVHYLVLTGTDLEEARATGIADQHARRSLTLLTKRGFRALLSISNSEIAIDARFEMAEDASDQEEKLQIQERRVLQLEDRSRRAEHKAANADNAVRHAQAMAELEVDLMRGEMNEMLKKSPGYKKQEVNWDKHTKVR